MKPTRPRRTVADARYRRLQLQGIAWLALTSALLTVVYLRGPGAVTGMLCVVGGLTIQRVMVTGTRAMYYRVGEQQAPWWVMVGVAVVVGYLVRVVLLFVGL